MSDFDKTVRFIKVNEKALSPTFDGFGFNMKFVGFEMMKKTDGRETFVLYTGWKMVFPEGYVGEVFDLPVMNLISGYRQEGSCYITNKYPYSTKGKYNELDLRTMGFSINIFPNAGLGSILFNPNFDYVSIVVRKTDVIDKMSLEVDIPEPIKEEEKTDKPS